jgi:type 1 glutamine amidotransferase
LRVDCHTNGWPEDDATLARQTDRGCGFAANIGHAYSLREHPDIRRLMMQAILWNAKVDDD